MADVKNESGKLVASNKKARHEYFIEEVYEIDIRSGDEYISVHELTQAEAQASESNVGQAVMSIEEINYLKNNIAFNYSRTYHFRKNFTAYFHIGNYLR